MRLKFRSKKENNRVTLCAAIRARRVVEFYYHSGYRTVEPYAEGIVLYGESTNESLICYQVEGISDNGRDEGWKLYRVSDMEDLAVKNEMFSGDRKGYDPDNIEMVELFECVRGVTPVPAAKAAPPPVRICTSPIPPPTARSPAPPRFLTHNMMMRKFRFGHRLPIPGFNPA